MTIKKCDSTLVHFAHGRCRDSAGSLLLLLLLRFSSKWTGRAQQAAVIQSEVQSVDEKKTAIESCSRCLRFRDPFKWFTKYNPPHNWGRFFIPNKYHKQAPKTCFSLLKVGPQPSPLQKVDNATLATQGNEAENKKGHSEGTMIFNNKHLL